MGSDGNIAFDGRIRDGGRDGRGCLWWGRSCNFTFSENAPGWYYVEAYGCGGTNGVMLTVVQVTLSSEFQTIPNRNNFIALPYTGEDVITARTTPATPNLTLEFDYRSISGNTDNIGELSEVTDNGDGTYEVTYKAKIETKANRCKSDPILSAQNIEISVVYGETKLADIRVGVRNVWGYLCLILGKEQMAIDYIAVKYDINYGVLFTPSLGELGAVYPNEMVIRLGAPTVGQTENLAASVIAHEHRHIVQGSAKLTAMKLDQWLYWVDPTSGCIWSCGEIEAYNSQLGYGPVGCLSPSDIGVIVDNRKPYCEVVDERFCYECSCN